MKTLVIGMLSALLALSGQAAFAHDTDHHDVTARILATLEALREEIATLSLACTPYTVDPPDPPVVGLPSDDPFGLIGTTLNLSDSNVTVTFTAAGRFSSSGYPDDADAVYSGDFVQHLFLHGHSDKVGLDFHRDGDTSAIWWWIDLVFASPTGTGGTYEAYYHLGTPHPPFGDDYYSGTFSLGTDAGAMAAAAAAEADALADALAAAAAAAEEEAAAQ